MAWSTPMTWVANQILTAAQLNAQLRDNCLALDVAQCTTQGSSIVATGLNTLGEVIPAQSTIIGSNNLTSTTYVATAANSVTAVTGDTALIMNSCRMQNNTANKAVFCSWAISGATTQAASDSWALETDGLGANCPCQMASFHLYTGLTPGTNTFTQQIRVDAGTGTVQNRQIAVWPQ